MSSEHAFKNIKKENVVHAKQQLITTEAEVLLEGGLREECKVFLTIAEPVVLGAEANGNQMLVDGKMNFHVLYAQGNLSEILSLDASKNFKEQCTFETEEKDLVYKDAYFHTELQSVNARIFNGKLLLKATFLLDIDMLFESNENVIEKANYQKQETKYKDIQSIYTVGKGEAETIVKSDVPLSKDLNIQSTLYGTASCQISDITGGDNGKINVSGTVILCATHLSSDVKEQIKSTKHELAFDQTVLLSGEMGEQISADCKVIDVALLLNNDKDVQTLRVEILLQTKVKAYKEDHYTLLEDAYCLDNSTLYPTYKDLKTCSALINEHLKESNKTTLMLHETDKKMALPLLAHLSPIVLQKYTLNHQMTIEGIMLCNLLYLSDDSAIPETCFMEEPFKISFKTDAPPQTMANLSLSDVDFRCLTSDRAEIKYIMHLELLGNHIESTPCITDITRKENTEDCAGIHVYFIDKNESLWDIGKKTGTALQDLDPRCADTENSLGQKDIVVTYKE